MFCKIITFGVKRIIFSLLIMLLALPSLILADGGMIPFEPVPIYETKQTALVFFEDGHEDLYLDVAYQGETDKFSWVVPVPSLPTAELASRKLFTELNSLSQGVRIRDYNDNIKDDRSLDSLDGVSVYSSEQLGIYSISIISATGINGLYEWFDENDYSVSTENESILQSYIDKSWYFVVVKINLEEFFETLINKFKEIDRSVNKLNFADKLADYIINAFLQKDYSGIENIVIDMEFLLVDTWLESIDSTSQEDIDDLVGRVDAPSDYDWDGIKAMLKAGIISNIYRLDNSLRIPLTVEALKIIDNSATEENMTEVLTEHYIDTLVNVDYQKFLDVYNVLLYTMPALFQNDHFDEEEYLKVIESETDEDGNVSEDAIEEAKDEIVYLIKEMIATVDNNNYNGRLSPIKISFLTDRAVYPLKISQVSSYSQDDDAKKPNYLNLYTISLDRLSVDSLDENFAKNIDAAYLDGESTDYSRF